MLDHLTRLGSFTIRWRMYVRQRDATPPYDAHLPIELRAPSEGMALELLARWCPDLEVLAIERCPGSAAA